MFKQDTINNFCHVIKDGIFTCKPLKDGTKQTPSESTTLRAIFDVSSTLLKRSVGVHKKCHMTKLFTLTFLHKLLQSRLLNEILHLAHIKKSKMF